MSEQEPKTTQSRIGTDEWVAQVGGRVRGRAGVWGQLAGRWEALPPGWRYGLVILLFLLIPPITGSQPVLNVLGISDNAFILRTGVRFLTFAMLAIGLNVVVGYAGLLDLGYIAFMGIAGYLYAYLSSEFVQIEGIIPYGLAVPTIVSVPVIMLLVGLLGWAIGAVSIRLAGDYLAIVTLGFGQIFVQLALTATRVAVPGRERPVDFTQGPNGINGLDNLRLLGFEFQSSLHYYYLFLLLLVLTYVVVHHLNQSRVGRAWRSIREDELAAELMGIPTRRMKLLAFAIGAGIAALAGATDAAFQGNVVPNPRYSALTLVNLYAMVVLGGTGSLPGALLGAFVFTVLPEVLRSVQLAGLLFYGLGVVGLWRFLRPFTHFLTVLVGTIVAGGVFKLLVNVLAPQWDTACSTLEAACPQAGSLLNSVVQGWLVIPENFQGVGNVVTGLAVVALLGVMVVRNGRYRPPLLALALYLFAFAWETRLAVEPAATRILIIGVTLVVLMITRPQGILGKAEVKII